MRFVMIILIGLLAKFRYFGRILIPLLKAKIKQFWIDRLYTLVYLLIFRTRKETEELKDSINLHLSQAKIILHSIYVLFKVQLQL